MDSLEFSAYAQWTGGEQGRGSVRAEGLRESQISLPGHFGGTVPGSNPEELLLSSLAGCLAMTLAFMYEGRRLQFNAIEVQATGSVVRGPTRFDRITAEIKVTARAESELERLREVAERAHEKCMISAIVKKSCEMSVSVEILRGT
jgi:peroxiredoxin-like protein